MTRYFVGDQREFIRQRRTNPNLILALRPTLLHGVPPDHIVWGDTADDLPNIDALRHAAGPVVQNVTPTVVATSPDDLDEHPYDIRLDMTRAQIQQMCQDAGLPTSGSKSEMLARIDAYPDTPAEDVETTVEVESSQEAVTEDGQ